VRLLPVFVALTAVSAHAGEPAASVLEVGGKPLLLSGPRECTYTGAGSIFDIPAAIWSVHQSAVNGSLNLSVFRLKSGGEMFSLNLVIDGRLHQVSTVKIGANGRIRGAGVIRVGGTAGAGAGSFSIEVRTESGVRISGTIGCARFGSPQDNG
jgi:hypothetical protein